METLIDNSINYACTTWASLIDVFQYWIPSIRRLLLVISAKTKSYQKNQMLCSRKSHKLDQVLFLRNQLLQLIARTISILRRAVLPEFLRISRNCTCKDCALFYHTYIYICIYIYIYIYITCYITYQVDYFGFCNLRYKSDDREDSLVLFLILSKIFLFCHYYQQLTEMIYNIYIKQWLRIIEDSDIFF